MSRAERIITAGQIMGSLFMFHLILSFGGDGKRTTLKRVWVANTTLSYSQLNKDTQMRTSKCEEGKPTWSAIYLRMKINFIRF